jgi:hypothetical protein
MTAGFQTGFVFGFLAGGLLVAVAMSWAVKKVVRP